MIELIRESLDVIRDETYPAEFRDQIKSILLECKDEIERLIIEFDN